MPVTGVPRKQINSSRRRNLLGKRLMVIHCAIESSYADKNGSSRGISTIGYKAGDPGKGQASAQGKNNSAKGQLLLPTGVVGQLTGNTTPTIQMLTSDGLCVTATMDRIKKDDGVRYLAELKQ